MKIIKKIIKYDEVENEFASIGEEFVITLIKFSFVYDCHFSAYALENEIFGIEEDSYSMVVDPPVCEYTIELDELLTREDLFTGIDKQKIPSLFCPRLLNELIKKNTRIEFNSGDESEELISLKNPGQGFLHAMTR